MFGNKFLCQIESGICQVAINILHMTSQKSNMSLSVHMQSNIHAFKIASSQPQKNKEVMNTNIFNIWPKSYLLNLSWHVMTRWCWVLSTFAGNCLYLVTPLPVMGPSGADWHGTQEVSQQMDEHPDSLIQINTHYLSSAPSCMFFCFFFVSHSFECLCCNLRMYSYK